jgi:hypothetical protein
VTTGRQAGLILLATRRRPSYASRNVKQRHTIFVGWAKARKARFCED